jgi:mannose-6-phosphate isomerase-like protein (cupin superfamily)
MATQNKRVQVKRWSGGQHPTQSNISRMMKKEGLRPYSWQNTPNYRYAVRSHNYDKVLYVINGSLELTLPDSNQRAIIKKGDRVDIPAGIRHGTNVGNSGVECVEAAIVRSKR